MDFPYLVFNFKNGDAPVDIKNSVESLAKAVSYFGGVKGLDILVTTPLDTPCFDTFGAFVNRVYDTAFDIAAYNCYCVSHGELVRDIADCIYSA